MPDTKEHIKQKKISDLQMRVDLFKEANDKLILKIDENKIKLNHKIRENVIMIRGYQEIIASNETPEHIKMYCEKIMENVEKYKIEKQ